MCDVYTYIIVPVTTVGITHTYRPNSAKRCDQIPRSQVIQHDDTLRTILQKNNGAYMLVGVYRTKRTGYLNGANRYSCTTTGT